MPDDQALSAEARKQLDHVLRFKRQPFITRIIFVAVPHRGSMLPARIWKERATICRTTRTWA